MQTGGIGMIVCMRCGAQNDPKENYCQECGATLPKLAYSMEMAQGVEKVMSLYEKFADAAEKVSSGEITLEEFENFVLDMQEKLRSREQEIREVDIPEHIMEDFEEELEVGFEGVEKINQGTETLLLFIEDEDEANLKQGLELIKEGLELIHRARLINRERDRKLGQAADMVRKLDEMEL